MDQMQKIEALNQAMDRIKELMDVTRMSMEELMATSANYNVDCDMCPIRTYCDQLRYFDCTDIWTKYLKGEIDVKKT